MLPSQTVNITIFLTISVLYITIYGKKMWFYITISVKTWQKKKEKYINKYKKYGRLGFFLSLSI